MKCLALICLLALAACTVTPEQRVRRSLVEAGLSPRMAACMAEPMVAKLSIAQLRRLSALGGLKGSRVEQMTLGEIAERARAIGDPEIVAVVSRAALGCAIAG